MTDYAASPPLTQESNDFKAALKDQPAAHKPEHGLNGNSSELKEAIPKNFDLPHKSLEQTDSLDMPHMDPSPINSPASSTTNNSNNSLPTSNGHNLPPSSQQVSPNPTLIHSPLIPNGIPGTPPYSPSLVNPQTTAPLPPLSPNIVNMTTKSSDIPTSTPLPTISPSNISPSTSTTKPASHEAAKPPTTLTPLPSLSTTPAASVVAPNHTKATAASNNVGSLAMNTQLQLEKAQKDLTRLRQHLMEMEEQHTLETEAMAEKIAQLESATQQNEKKGSSQDNTIQNLTAINERLTSTLREKELDLETNTAALYNLQNVLAQFQLQREEDIKNETQALRNEATRASQQATTFKKERDVLQEKVKRIGELEELTRSLQHELTEKTRTILMMQEEVEPLRKALNHSAEQMSQMAKYEQSLVEKSVVTKLIVTYLSGGKKQEVLSLMARILNFTEEEMQKVGLMSSKGWIPFLRSSSSLPSPRGERSVGDLWMEFLLKEVGDAAPGGGGGESSASNPSAGKPVVP